MLDREILTWTDFGPAARELAQQVAGDGYRPDVILSIARGGLLVGGALAYALNVKSCYLVNIEFYTGVDERREEPIVLPPRLDLAEAREAKVLVADDVADTGHTLKRVEELLQDRVAETRTAVLYEKPRSLIQCEYVWRRTEAWIEFPWSKEPAVV